MGLAANQARLLTLTARMHDLERSVMLLSAEKMIYSIQSMNVTKTYNQEMEVAENIQPADVQTGSTPVQRSRTVEGANIAVTGRSLKQKGYELIINNAGGNGGGSSQSSGRSVSYQHTFATYANLPTNFGSTTYDVGDIALVQSDSTHDGKASYYQVALDYIPGSSTGTVPNPDYENIPKTANDLLQVLIRLGYLNSGVTPVEEKCNDTVYNCNEFDLQFPARKDIIDQRTGNIYRKAGDLVSLRELAQHIGMSGTYTSIAAPLKLNATSYRGFFNFSPTIDGPTSDGTYKYSWSYYGDASADQQNEGGNDTLTQEKLNNMSGAEIQVLILSGDVTLRYNGQEVDEVPATLQGDSTIEYYTEDVPIMGKDYTERDAAKRRAQTKYDTELAKISMREKMLDMKLTQDNTELSACNKEYESVKSLIEKNVEQGFKMFS